MKCRKGGKIVASSCIGDLSALDESNTDASVARRRKAFIACLLAILAFLLTAAMSSGSWAGSQFSSYVSNIWDSLKKGDSLDVAMKGIGAEIATEDNIPRWLLEEVLDEEWLVGAISDESKKVFWITRAGYLSDVQKELAKALKEKDWIAISDNGANVQVSTFAKKKGECRWIIAELSQQEAETAVVLRIERN